METEMETIMKEMQMVPTLEMKMKVRPTEMPTVIITKVKKTV